MELVEDSDLLSTGLSPEGREVDEHHLSEVVAQGVGLLEGRRARVHIDEGEIRRRLGKTGPVDATPVVWTAAVIETFDTTRLADETDGTFSTTGIGSLRGTLRLLTDASQGGEHGCDSEYNERLCYGSTEIPIKRPLTIRDRFWGQEIRSP
jgi:hypothetical protein